MSYYQVHQSEERRNYCSNWQGYAGRRPHVFWPKKPKKKSVFSFMKVAQTRPVKEKGKKKKNDKHQLNQLSICPSPWKTEALGHSRIHSFLHLIISSWIFPLIQHYLWSPHLPDIPVFSNLTLQLSDASFMATQGLWEHRDKQLVENVWAKRKQKDLLCKLTRAFFNRLLPRTG